MIVVILSVQTNRLCSDSSQKALAVKVSTKSTDCRSTIQISYKNYMRRAFDMKSVVITGELERLWPWQFWAHKTNRTHNGGLVFDFLVM